MSAERANRGTAEGPARTRAAARTAAVCAGLHALAAALLFVRAGGAAGPLVMGFAALGAVLWAFEAWTAAARAGLSPGPASAQSSSLFLADQEGALTRHRNVERLVGRGLSALSAAALAVGAAHAWGVGPAFMLRAAATETRDAHPLEAAALAAGLGFALFVAGRYARGAARSKAAAGLEHATGYTGAAALLLGLLAGAHGLRAAGYPTPLGWVPPLAGGLFAFVAAEILLGLVTGGFRPRRGLERLRPAYASRLLDAISDPGSAAGRLDEAIDYQLGFAASDTRGWRRLVGAAPAFLAAVACLALLGTAVVVVGPNERARLSGPFGAGEARIVGPGAHLGWPWPFGEAVTVDMGAVRELSIGSISRGDGDGPALWTRARAAADAPFLVAGPASGDGAAASLASAELGVQFTVTDVGRYLAVQDPDAQLRALAQAEAARYLAARSLDALIRADRVVMAATLRDRVQARADAVGLGVRIAAVPVASVQPPVEVAASFYAVARATEEYATRVSEAERAAEARLAAVAGSTELAAALAREIDRHAEQARAPGTRAEDLAAQATRIEGMLLRAGGEAASALEVARQQAWERTARERALALRFEVELQALARAPSVYRAILYLDALTSALADPGVRKIILATDREHVVTRYGVTDPDGDLFRAFGGSSEPGSQGDR